ncbi:MAG: hypothetical protein FWD57_10730 [Polyangiaceae bacterium]|nr:hypothetical protein [Polyangiaceae bacterium]
MKTVPNKLARTVVCTTLHFVMLGACSGIPVSASGSKVGYNRSVVDNSGNQGTIINNYFSNADDNPQHPSSGTGLASVPQSEPSHPTHGGNTSQQTEPAPEWSGMHHRDQYGMSNCEFVAYGAAATSSVGPQNRVRVVVNYDQTVTLRLICSYLKNGEWKFGSGEEFDGPGRGIDAAAPAPSSETNTLPFARSRIWRVKVREEMWVRLEWTAKELDDYGMLRRDFIILELIPRG